MQLTDRQVIQLAKELQEAMDAIMRAIELIHKAIKQQN